MPKNCNAIIALIYNNKLPTDLISMNAAYLSKQNVVELDKYQIRKTVSDHVSKHPEESWNTSAQNKILKVISH